MNGEDRRSKSHGFAALRRFQYSDDGNIRTAASKTPRVWWSRKSRSQASARRTGMGGICKFTSTGERVQKLKKWLCPESLASRRPTPLAHCKRWKGNYRAGNSRNTMYGEPPKTKGEWARQIRGAAVNAFFSFMPF